MTNADQLNAARRWALSFTVDTIGNSDDNIEAARLIHSLPDAWVDAEGLRHWLDLHGDDLMQDAVDDLKAMIPHKVPRAVIGFGNRAWHDGLGEVVMTSAKPDGDGDVLIHWLGKDDQPEACWINPDELAQLEEEEEAESSSATELPTVGESWIVECDGKNYYAIHDGAGDSAAPWALITRTGYVPVYKHENQITRVAQLFPKDTK